MQGYTLLNAYRFERKFVAEKVPRQTAEHVVKQNSAFFTIAFPSRQVNNIYFDTPGMDCYFDNLFGIGDRWKVRVRWYGNMYGHVQSPILEFKIKKGFAGIKRSYLLPPFVLEQTYFSGGIWKEFFLSSNLPDEARQKLSMVQPVLLNTYQRSYFTSFDRKFRITVDDDMKYYNLRPSWNHFMHVHREQLKSVLELKYDRNWLYEAEQITNQIPFRLDKNSKYVSGISHFRSEIAR